MPIKSKVGFVRPKQQPLFYQGVASSLFLAMDNILLKQAIERLTKSPNDLDKLIREKAENIFNKSLQDKEFEYVKILLNEEMKNINERNKG